MRPSRLLVAIVLLLTGLTVLLVLAVEDAAAVLLFVWGGLAALAMVDLMLTLSRRDLTIEVNLPESGFNGLSVPLGVALSTRRGTLPNEFEIRLSLDEGLSAGWDRPIQVADGAQDMRLETRMGLRERGDKNLHRLSMRYSSRLRLFEIIADWVLDRTISVMPNITPILNGTIQTQMLPLIDGAKDMRLRGEGSEFHQLRDFVAGMDPRTIDWKRSARLHSLTARETRAERNHQIILCLDSGHLMGERIGQLSKLDQAINAALALSWAGGLGGDLVGFYSFNSRPRAFVPPRPGRAAFAHIQATSVALVHDTAETNHTLGLSNLNSKLMRRSLVVVFSDFVDSVTAELLIENLAVMTRKHLVLYVAIRDPALLDIVHPDDVTMDTISQSVSARQILQERQQVLDRLRRLGILCLDTEPAALTAALLSRYIDIKSQELI
ncbi:MAG: DUF58 domain-containing protein [Pseudomonadota bacterium]